MKDYYQILDIPMTATLEQIRTHYKLLVAAYHPDQFTSPLNKAFAEDKLKQINIAFQVLCGTPLETSFEAFPELRPQPEVEPPRIEIGPLPIGTKTVCRFQVNNLGAETRSMKFIYSTEDGWFRVSKGRRIYADKPFPLEFELTIHTKGLAPGQQYEEWLTMDLDGSKVRIPLILKIDARQPAWKQSPPLVVACVFGCIMASAILSLPFPNLTIVANALSNNHLDSLSQFALRPNELIFAIEENGQSALYLSQTSSASLQHLGITGWSATTTANGQRLAYLSNRDGQPEIFLFNVETGIREQLTANHSDKTNLTWSPDGKTLAYLTSEKGEMAIVLIDVATHHETHLRAAVADTLDGDMVHYMWSPDGQTLLFDLQNHGERRVYRVSVHGDGLQQLTRVNTWDGAWSPDGTEVLVASDTGIYKLTSQGQYLGHLTQKRAAKPRWSANGEYISFLASAQEDKDQVLWVMNANGTNLNKVTSENVLNYQWAPQGNRLAYVTGNTTSNPPLLYVWTTEVGKTSQLLAEVNHPQLAWTY